MAGAVKSIKLHVEMFSGQLAWLHSNALCPHYIICKQLPATNGSHTPKVFVSATLESIWIIVSGFMRSVHVRYLHLHIYLYRPVD